MIYLRSIRTVLPAALAALQLALLPPPAGATLTPAARRVVDRYVEASGGMPLFDSLRTLSVEGALSAFGMSGRARVWHVRPDRSATEIELGPFKLAEGFDGMKKASHCRQ